MAHLEFHEGDDLLFVHLLHPRVDVTGVRTVSRHPRETPSGPSILLANPVYTFGLCKPICFKTKLLFLFGTVCIVVCVKAQGF